VLRPLAFRTNAVTVDRSVALEHRAAAKAAPRDQRKRFPIDVPRPVVPARLGNLVDIRVFVSLTHDRNRLSGSPKARVGDQFPSPTGHCYGPTRAFEFYMVMYATNARAD